MRTRTAVAGIGGAAAVGVALQVLGRVAGSTSEERGAALPGDELVPDPQLVTSFGDREYQWTWRPATGKVR